MRWRGRWRESLVAAAATAAALFSVDAAAAPPAGIATPRFSAARQVVAYPAVQVTLPDPLAWIGRIPKRLPGRGIHHPQRLPVGVPVIAPAGLPHGTGPAGALVRRLPHGLGAVGDLPMMLGPRVVSVGR